MSDSEDWSVDAIMSSEDPKARWPSILHAINRKIRQKGWDFIKTKGSELSQLWPYLIMP